MQDDDEDDLIFPSRRLHKQKAFAISQKSVFNMAQASILFNSNSAFSFGSKVTYTTTAARVQVGGCCAALIYGTVGFHPTVMCLLCLETHANCYGYVGSFILIRLATGALLNNT